MRRDGRARGTRGLRALWAGGAAPAALAALCAWAWHGAGGPEAERCDARRLELLTGDRCLVECRVVVEREAAGSPAPRVARLAQRAAEAAAASAVAHAALPDLLGPGVSAVETAAAAAANASLEARGEGDVIAAVRLRDVRPIGAAGEALARAGEAGKTRRETVAAALAHTERMRVLAAGESAALLAAARAHAERAAAASRDEAARFAALLGDYRVDPAGVAERLFEETMTAVLSTARTRVAGEAPEPAAGSAGRGRLGA